MRGSAATECNSRRYFAAARRASIDLTSIAMLVNRQVLTLAMPHLSQLRAVLLDRSRSVPRGLPSFSAFAAGLPHAADADARLLRRRQSDFQVQLREIGAWSPRRERHSAAGHAQARANPRVLKVNYFYPTTLWRAWTECASRHESSSFPRAHKRSRRAQ